MSGFGFLDEEPDFTTNYDIKYRMGKGAGKEEDVEHVRRWPQCF